MQAQIACRLYVVGLDARRARDCRHPGTPWPTVEDRSRETLTPPKVAQTLYKLEGLWKGRPHDRVETVAGKRK